MNAPSSREHATRVHLISSAGQNSLQPRSRVMTLLSALCYAWVFRERRGHGLLLRQRYRRHPPDFISKSTKVAIIPSQHAAFCASVSILSLGRFHTLRIQR